MSLSTLGWDGFFERQLTAEDREASVPARVVWVGRGVYRLSTVVDEWTAVLPGRLRHRTRSRAELPTVGDWVLASSQTIQRVLTRRSAFSRGMAGRAAAEQILAANIDTVLLVTSLNRDFNLRRVERYLALAWESGANPVIVLSKADLCSDPEASERAVSSCAQGVPVVVVSALRGDCMTDLHRIVREGGTTALLGSSGVGKSTLINTLLGDSRQPVREIREDDDRGRHATTSRELFLVPGGGIIIDTPGMREVQLWDAERGLERAFADVEELAGHCRFRDCSHVQEPGCAVADAVAEGRLDAARLESYRRLQREERFLESLVDDGARADRHRREKQGSKAIRQMSKLRRR